MMKATNAAMVMTSQVVRDASYPLVGIFPPLGEICVLPESQCLSERDRLALDQAKQPHRIRYAIAIANRGTGPYPDIEMSGRMDVRLLAPIGLLTPGTPR